MLGLALEWGAFARGPRGGEIMIYERRRDVRFSIHLPALFLPACGLAHVENASYHGLLMQLDVPVALGQLYRVELCVASDAALVLNLVPVRKSLDAHGRHELIGARILGHDLRWEAFVSDLRSHSGPRIVTAADVATLVKGVA